MEYDIQLQRKQLKEAAYNKLDTRWYKGYTKKLEEDIDNKLMLDKDYNKPRINKTSFPNAEHYKVSWSWSTIELEAYKVLNTGVIECNLIEWEACYWGPSPNAEKEPVRLPIDNSFFEKIKNLYDKIN
jgi:hypothetical protein